MDIKEKIKEKFGNAITDWRQPSSRRVYLGVSRDDIFRVSEFLFKTIGLRLATVSACQVSSGFEILYHFSDDKSGTVYSLRVELRDRDRPCVDSITPICSAAEWVEREIWEMLGITFKNHPNLKRLLLAEDWPDGKYPLRKQES